MQFLHPSALAALAAQVMAGKHVPDAEETRQLAHGALGYARMKGEGREVPEGEAVSAASTETAETPTGSGDLSTETGESDNHGDAKPARSRRKPAAKKAQG